MKKSFGKRLASFFTAKRSFDVEFFEDLEDLLIEGDLGAVEAFEFSEKLQEVCRKEKISGDDALLMLKKDLSQYIDRYDMKFDKDATNFILVLGVNGVGKTTSIAKMAARFNLDGYSTVLSAADTFRAAAVDQLNLHAQRLQTRIVMQTQGADPGAVIYDTISSAQAKGEHIILADTAGRMHTKDNLLKELQKIDKIIKNRIDSANYIKVLVIDSTTGQNGIRQAEMFHEAIGVDSLILTKYDSAAKGGSIIQIGKKLGIPVSFVGTGEKYSDLELFDKEEFLNSLLGIE